MLYSWFMTFHDSTTAFDASVCPTFCQDGHMTDVHLYSTVQCCPHDCHMHEHALHYSSVSRTTRLKFEEVVAVFIQFILVS